jgi:hypothetical protein
MVMARIDTPADPLGELVFELERFAWTEDRLEVVGRWFGVGGRRFIRPTLHLRLGDRRRRLIALLDDKPWAADGEGAWTASFAWPGEHDGVTAARLEVAPDLILDLPVPGENAAGVSLTSRPRPRREPRKPVAPRRPKPAPKPAAAVPKPAAVVEPPAAPEPAAVVEPPAAPEPAADPRATAIFAPAPSRPAVPAHAPPSVAAEIAALALERRLAEQRAERERLEEELARARREIASLSAHQATAVERAKEVVALEGQLAAANARADAAEARAAELERAAPIEVAPLPPRIERRRESPQRHGAGAQAAAVAAVAVIVALVVIVITSF